MPLDAYVASATLAILVVAIVVVKAVTFAVGGYRKYREPRLVICPEDGGHARVEFQAEFAALMEALGIGRLVIRNCSRWPERRACQRKCLRQIKTARDPRELLPKGNA